MSNLITALLALTMLGPAGEGPFLELSFEQALAEAKKADKVVFVEFFTTWSGPSAKLDRTTWQDEGVRAWLSEIAVPISVDAEREIELAKRYRIRSYPTLLFVRPDGEDIDRIDDYMGPARFLSTAPRLLSGTEYADRLPSIPASTEAVDLFDRLRAAREHAVRGEHADALEIYLWLWHHAADSDPTWAAVRTSSLLAELVRISGVHPPAREALVSRRDAAEHAVLSGTATTEHVEDLAALNRVLNETERTLRVWDALAESEAYAGRAEAVAGLREAMAYEVVEAMLRERRYEDALETLDIRKDVRSEIELFRRTLGRSPDERHVRSSRRFLVDRRAKEVEALLGLGRTDQAQERIDALIELDPSAETFGWLLQRAARAGDVTVVESVLARAREVLRPEEVLPLEQFAKRAAER